jgi:pimeloyl-ACP methyl ester carboxylesterase
MVSMPKKVSGFELIEHLFDEVAVRSGNANSVYYLYGHSAGAQFVHRMLLLKPDARIKRAVAANAGFYTLPRFAEEYPYGLVQSGLAANAVQGAFGKDLTILLGEADTLENQHNLNRSPGAMLQGKHRFARGMNFYKVAQEESGKSGVALTWKLKTVPGSGHSNIKMAAAAAQALFATPLN